MRISVYSKGILSFFLLVVKKYFNKITTFKGKPF